MKNVNPFQGHWKNLLDMPRENLITFCSNLFMHSNSEKNMAQGIAVKSRIQDSIKFFVADPTLAQSKEDIDEALLLDRMYIFIYENIEAGFIKNKATQFIYGNEYYTCYLDYYAMLLAQFPDDEFPELNTTYTVEQRARITSQFHNVKERITGYVNPREVIELFYFSDLGKTFLPHSLIEYLKKKLKLRQCKNTPNSSPIVVPPYIDKKYIFLNYKDILEEYKTKYSTRSNDALVARVNLLLHSVDKNIAAECGIDSPITENKSQAIAKAKRDDIPRLKNLYPHLPDLYSS